MKTFLALTLACAASMTPIAAKAVSSDLAVQARGFANCAGRLSALMEHQWLFDGDASEDTQLRRAAFVDLIEAVLPDLQDQGVDGRQVLHWRIEAKMAQAQLLQRATFGAPGRDTRQARIISQRYLQQCNGLLLG